MLRLSLVNFGASTSPKFIIRGEGSQTMSGSSLLACLADAEEDNEDEEIG